MAKRKEYDELQKYYGNIPEFLKKYLRLKILRRLKDVGMLCGIDYAYHKDKYMEYYVSRYDHSFGTAMTVWKLTNNKKWTLAALFHDISTPVFSHIIDFVNGDFLNQESTEEMTEVVLNSSRKLKEYLKSDGLKIKDIANFKDYSVVDLPRPKMCADRLNNVMTVGMGWIGSLDLNDAKYVIDHIEVETNEEQELELSFTDSKAAEIYINTNDSLNNRLAIPDDDYLTDLLVKIVKYCLDKKYVSYEQLFFITETEMFEIIESNSIKDKELYNMYNTFKTIEDPPIIEVDHEQKPRKVNPLIKGKRYY